MKGYIANVTNNGIVTFTGALNTGVKSIILSRTTGQTKEGFNLVGNPYSSYLNWENTTKLRIQSTFWCRTTKLIKGLTSENAYLRLEISNAINTDKTLIYSNTGASDNFDSYDTPKMFNDDPLYPEIFTTIGTEQLAMNGLSSIPYNLEIPIGLKIDALTENTYSIKVDGFNNLLPNTKIIIKDYQNPQSVISRDITDGSPYTFTSGAVNTSARFTITFENINTVYVFDTYNATGQIAIDNSGKGTNNKIPPMQAFWVRVDNAQTSGSLTVDNTMCSHKNIIDPVFKSNSTSEPSQSILRLQVSNGTNTDETVIYVNPSAFNTYDTFDSKKMFNNSAAIAEIFTVAENEQLAINGLNNLLYNTEIPVGFNTFTSGTFTIKASLLRDFEIGTQVILKDNQTQTVTDLSNGSGYTFTSDISTNNTNRFSLIFDYHSINDVLNTNVNKNIWISVNSNNQLIVNGSSLAGITVDVHNTVGQHIVSKTLNGNERILFERSLQAGVYLITFNHNGQKATQKFIL